MSTDEEFIQQKQYEFPYHHIPHLEGDSLRNTRVLRWGFEYMAYLIEVKQHLVQMDPRSVLDVGCGDGRFLGMLPDNMERVGVDRSEKAIRFAKAFQPELEFRTVDIEDMTRTFDVVTAIEVLEHIPDEEIRQFILNLGQRCAVDGSIILTVPSKRKSVIPKHHRHYDWELLESTVSPLLDRDFQTSKRYELLTYSRLVDWYKYLTMNSKWMIEIPYINKFLWEHFQKSLVRADRGEGKKLCLTLQRSP